ncbi:MAG: glycosyltransferase [Janthinobacterium lividum]
MPPTSPVLLVLAWDDADPAVHRVAATAALPALPTLPLVRALAAGQPTLAVLPQLPEPATAEPAAGPAVVDLGAGSHLVGLGDFTPDALAAGWAAPHPAPNAPAAGSPASLANVQLRPPLAQRAAAGWQAPAAPYLGSAETVALPTTEASVAEVTPTAEAAAATARVLAPVGAPATPAEAPRALNGPISVSLGEGDAPAPLFDQTEPEIGAGEAADLAEDDPDLSVDAAPPVGPARASLTQGLAALHRAPATATEALPPAFDLSDGLHYRVIQYARFATYVLDGGGEDFGVIYAPDWPTWLAALEIRTRTRRPLVVHLRLLAAESAAPAERGWLLELERTVLRFAHTVLVVSDELRAHALRHYPLLAPSQVRIVAADDADGVRAVLAEIGQAARP